MPQDEFSLKDIDFHRATAASYDEEVTEVFGIYHRYLLDPFLDRVANAVGPAPALDLGCGTGVISLALAQRGFEVLGIDHSPEMLAIAEKKLELARVPGGFRFAVGDVRAVPAHEGEFACVTAQGLLHHLSEMETCLREIVRVLRPGGFFYISEPCVNQSPLKRALAAAWHLVSRQDRSGKSDEPESVEAPIDAEDLRALLSRLELQFDMEFLTHLGPLRPKLPDGIYLFLVRLVSSPWRRRQGDLVFVFGRKPEQAST